MISNVKQSMISLKVLVIHSVRHHCIIFYLAPRRYIEANDPFRHQVEYTRALNAAKLERVFAKPFIASLAGHNDAVHILKKHPKRLSTILSGARDGQLKIWHLTGKKCISTIQAHNGPLNGKLITLSLLFIILNSRDCLNNNLT